MMEETYEVRMGRYLSGEAGSDERESFERELESNPALKQEFLVFEKIWNTIPVDSTENWDEDAAWKKMMKSAQPELKENIKIRKFYLKWPVAAAFLVAFGALLFFWNQGKPVTYAYDDKHIEAFTLKDGSKIYLHRGSSLDVYPFKHKSRRVVLHGEALFEVKPDPNRPFTVEAGSTITEVVGTVFDIAESSAKTTIYVQQGRVIFKSTEAKKDAVALTEGEAAVYDNSRIQRIPNPSPNVNAWHTKRLSFTRNMSLADIISDASAYFNVLIFLENVALNDCHISSPLIYNDPEINTVLKPLASFINGTIRVEDNQYTIQGGNCP